MHIHTTMQCLQLDEVKELDLTTKKDADWFIANSEAFWKADQSRAQSKLFKTWKGMRLSVQWSRYASL